MDQVEWASRVEKLGAEYDPFRNLEHLVEVVQEPRTISSWNEFLKWFAPFKQAGCFRGQANSKWHLFPSFYRKVHQRWSHGTSVTVDSLNPEENEQRVFRDFQRAAHHHYSNLPPPGEVVDWFTIMQHHGAPTRMLDWTRSPYVALYFAMQEDNDAKKAALWAIDLDWLRQRSYELLCNQDPRCPGGEHPDVFRSYINEIFFRQNNPHVIISASPARNNERMQIQQGEMLCALQHRPSFPEILLGMLVRPEPVRHRQVVSKVSVKRESRFKFLEELRRMNIHEASLFPGLDGFTRSLGVNLEIEVARQIESRNEDFRQYLKEKAARK